MLCDVIFSQIECVDDCWEWQGRIANGYAKIWHDNLDSRVHRIIYQLCVGEIPNGLFVLHSCDNRRCVNPSHLFTGTQQDNIDDMFQKNRQPNFKGQNNNAAKLTEDDILQIKKLHGQNRYTQNEISDMFNVSRRLVGMIVNGQRWPHIGVEK